MAATLVVVAAACGALAVLLRQEERERPHDDVIARSAAVERATNAPADAGISTLSSPDARTRMVILRLDSDPPGATLQVGGAHLDLPASLERPMGTEIQVLLEKAGCEQQVAAVIFDEPRSTVFSLRRLPEPSKASQVKRSGKRARGDFNWKEIYVRSGDAQQK